MAKEIWLIRHGETEWSLSGAHTGRTDVPLTKKGEDQARALSGRLSGQRFDLVLTSPLRRALRTCELAGLGEQAKTEPNLLEWDYGAYEGKTSEEIRKMVPGWAVFQGAIPGGETITEVGTRAAALIRRTDAESGTVALFAHGHILRILAACWIGMEPAFGEKIALATASVSVLGFEHENRVITRWNLSA